jgi:hypothetical protein
MRRLLFVCLILVLLITLIPTGGISAKINHGQNNFTAAAEIVQTYTPGFEPIPEDDPFFGEYAFRTIGETFRGQVTSSSWPELENAQVCLVNNTYFNLSFTTGAIDGFDDAVIVFDQGCDKLIVQASGMVHGTYPVSATIEMNWYSIYATGAFNQADARGTFTAAFDWTTQPSSGTGNISGVYKNKHKK